MTFGLEMPKPDEVLFSLGPYRVVRSIGKGGMGEVFLAYDTVGKRNVALKCLTKEKKATVARLEQFLKEAHYTSLLAHPAIIPIYSVSAKGDTAYYTMPFIEGRTLKELLASPKEHERAVSSLCPIFLRICQAIAYAHSKGFIHRDLKPSNIMVGDYGEVYILDWGLVEPVTQKVATKRRKQVSGTMAYLAPELMYGGQPTYRSEIYSLGMILYQMLTLRNPFHRSDIHEYHENIEREVLVDPAKVAPYRNIPPILSHIALKCLAESAEERYGTVEELLHDLQTILEQRADWIKVSPLDLQKEKGKWLSKPMYTGDVKVTAAIDFKGGKVGFLVPSSGAEVTWIASEHLKPRHTHHIRIESKKGEFHLYIDECLIDTSMRYLPSLEAQVGVIFTDPKTRVTDFSVYRSGESFGANPLAAADALLAYKQYPEALKEYQRVGSCYPDTEAGRRGLFYAGIALLENGKESQAIKEFEKFKGTNAGPLAYLGKALVYKAQGNYEEAARAFEKAFDHNLKHPLFKQLQLTLSGMLPECDAWPRQNALHMFLLAARYLPPAMTSANAAEAFNHFTNRLESAFFLTDEEIKGWTPELQLQAHAIQLAFWASRPDVIEMIIDDALSQMPAPLPIIQDALMALIELGELEKAQEKLDLLFQRHLDVQARAKLELIHCALRAHQEGFKHIDERFFNSLPRSLTKENLQPVWHIFEEALQQNKTEVIHKAAKLLKKHSLSDEQSCYLDFYEIWAFLLEGDLDSSGRLLKLYGPRKKADAFNFLYGCHLAAKKGKNTALKHFSKLSREKLPDLWQAFLAALLPTKEKIHGKQILQDACPWELRRLSNRLSLFRLLAKKD